jgi:hypothetical protein
VGVAEGLADAVGLEEGWGAVRGHACWGSLGGHVGDCWLWNGKKNVN